MASVITVFLVLGQLSGPQSPKAIPPYESVEAEAVKLSNSLDKEVTFDYQFEDARWRKVTIRPNSATYIWHQSPTRPLLLEFHNGRQLIRHQLATSTVPLYRAPDGDFQPEFPRNDEARPYFFTTRNGSLTLYSGFDSAWVAAATQSVLKSFGDRQLDVALLSGRFDVKKIDPIIFEAEWSAAEEILVAEYQKRMRTTAFPTLERYWERSSIPKRESDLTPRIVIRSCGTRFSADFMKNIINQITGDLADNVQSFVAQCAAVDFIRKGRLAPEFTKGGKLELFRIQKAVTEDLAKNSVLGVASETQEGRYACRVLSQWQYVKSERFQYRWRASILIAVSSNDGEEYGLDITTDITAQKQAISSKQWHNLSDVGVAHLGFLRESSLFIANGDGDHSQSPKTNFISSESVSKAMQLSRTIHKRVESVLVTQ